VAETREITPCPAISTRRVHLFWRSELTAARTELDADEVLAVHRMPLSGPWNDHTGDIQDAKTICALLLASKWLINRQGTVGLLLSCLFARHAS